jgi:hypothetical protein
MGSTLIIPAAVEQPCPSLAIFLALDLSLVISHYSSDTLSMSSNYTIYTGYI